jgi:hypothetical protein
VSKSRRIPSSLLCRSLQPPLAALSCNPCRERSSSWASGRDGFLVAGLSRPIARLPV